MLPGGSRIYNLHDLGHVPPGWIRTHDTQILQKPLLASTVGDELDDLLLILYRYIVVILHEEHA